VHFAKCQKGAVQTLDAFYQVDPPKRMPNKRRSATVVREPVGTALKARIEGLLTIKSGKGCGCTNLAAQMDQWGIAGCERERETILNALTANRDILTQALRSHQGIIAQAGGLISSLLPDSIMRLGAGILLNEAIADVRNRPKPIRRPLKPTDEKRAARFTFEPSDNWTSTTRHLTFHIWPTKTHDGWKWNLQQLAKRWGLFNGTKVMAVALSHDAETAATVVDYASSIGIAFDHVIGIQNNKTIREVATWVPMLRLLNPSSASHSEVVFSAHAKGVRHSALTSTLETWARIMYEACLDDWPTVENHLQRYLATGAFKRYNNFTTPGNDCWHYSGTFFWWRLRELGNRNWQQADQKFFGTESWLGLHAKHEETGCLFVDGVQNLYDANYMSEIETQWKAHNET
tara:strand:- start:1561 stop:2769 length:1209 start_codon:yes stop_codon:yes gene_type:complete